MTSTRLTAEEYYALPNTDRWTQLIDGRWWWTSRVIDLVALSTAD